MGLRGPGAKPVTAKTTTDKPRRKTRKAWTNARLTRAEAAVKFIESLKLTAGRHAGQRFRLRDWQQDIVSGVYRGGARQGLISTARKNGKTQLACSLAAAHLFGPMAEPRGEVYSAASDRNQAARVFRELQAMILADDELAGRCNIQRFAKRIEVMSGPGAGSVYEALSSDARKAHSLSPSFVVCDELAQWPSRELYDNLTTGTGARENPLVVVISTMSSDPNHVMSELVDYGQKVNDGLIEDPSFYAAIFTTPLDADPWEESSWLASNPALGDFRSLAEMRKFAEQAQRIPAKEAVFRSLYLNQPVATSHEPFIQNADWAACASGLSVDRLRGRRCFGGLDLSGKNDLTSLTLVFPADESLDVLPFFWTPGDTLEERGSRDRASYALWAGHGHLEAKPGRTIDYAWVAHKLAELDALYEIEAIAFDRYRIDDLLREMEEIGLDLMLIQHGAGYRDMSPAVEALEDAVLEGRLRHPDHPVLNWCMTNVRVTQDPAGNRKLDKAKSTGRIDGAVSLAMAVSASITHGDSFVTDTWDFVTI